MDKERLKLLVDKLRSLPRETEWVEFKLNYLSEEEIGKRLSALANGACLNNKPFGYLIFGIVDQTHESAGTTYSFLGSKKGNEEIQHWILQRLEPRLNFKVYEFDYDGKSIVIIKVPASKERPVRFRHKAYIRIGSITRDLEGFPDKEKALWLKTDKDSFETGICKESVSSDEVIRLLDAQCYFDLLDIPFPSTREAVLEKFISEKFIMQENGHYHITNLGGILFAKDLNQFDKLNRKAVRVIVYKEKDRINTLKDQMESGGYAVCFERLIGNILDKLPSNEEVQKALRKNVTIYPPIAVRELTANALIHQNLNEQGTGPMVEIFSDRLEITNPGIPVIQTERFIDEYKSRNEDLASFLRRVGVCEEKGSGIDKVIGSVEAFQLPAPEFQVMSIHTKAILYAPRILRAMDRKEKIRACYQHCCLKYVSNEKMTNTSLRERFSIPEKNSSSVSRIIADTISSELVKYDDPQIVTGRYVKYVPFWA